MTKKKALLSTTLLILFVFLMVSVNSTDVLAKTIKWRMISVWHPSLKLFEADKKFVEMVNEMSGGRLEIKLFGAGEVVPSFEVFGAVQSGAVPLGGDAPLYWGGKDPVFSLLGTSTMMLSWVDELLWIYHGGGLKLFQEAYGKHGLVWFPTTILSAESGFRTNKPINNLEDLKGLKIRISGKFQQKLISRLGASPVMLSGGEVYQALEKGTIDGTEFSLPSIDWTMGLAEVAKYWLTPAGLHQANAPIGVLINKKAFDKLPDDLKKIVQNAAMATCLLVTTDMEYANIEAIKNFKKAGVKITRLPDKDVQKIQKIYNEILIEECKKNSALADVLQSQVKYLKDFADWREMSSPFSFGRNLKQYPDLNQ